MFNAFGRNVSDMLQIGAIGGSRGGGCISGSCPPPPLLDRGGRGPIE